MILQGPADDFSALKIHQRGQIEPAFGGGDIGDVADPDLIDSGNPLEAQLGQMVRGDLTPPLASNRGPGPKGLLCLGFKPLLAHQSSDPILRTGFSLQTQLTRHSGASVTATILLVDLFYLLTQIIIVRFSLGRILLPLHRPVIATAAHIEGLTDFADRVLSR